MSAVAMQPLFVYRPAVGQGLTSTVRPAAIVRAAAVVRSAVAADAAAVHGLITDHAAEGRLLSRTIAEIAAHIDRFVVATVSGRVVGCADLAPLSRATAEVRSLVVAEHARCNGLGRRLLAEVISRASLAGFGQLCAFTHSAAYFVQAGFSIVPHAWVPEKIGRDCRTCTSFGQCGQYALVLPLAGPGSRFVL